MQELIKQYTELRTAYDLESAEYERARAEIMAKVQDELDAVSAEFSPRLTAASEKFTAIEAEIKTAVKSQGKTEKEALDGYAAAHPEISQFKAEGEPSVSVRAVK